MVRQLLQRAAWESRARAAASLPDPPALPLKVFKPKVALPILTDYKRDPGRHFWDKFPSNYAPGKSMISVTKLRGLVLAVGTSDTARLNTVCADLEHGADIGCTGAARAPTRSSNAPSALLYPLQVTDAIASWLLAGFAIGPFLQSDVPVNAKVSGIMTRPKPNGSVRVILNFSSPAGLSVNDGIDNSLFPATMSSTAKWISVLNRAGRGAYMIKMDWADAYKHVHVRAPDVDLQWFSWLGRFFAEVCLVFGAASSPGIYDRVAKTVLDIVLRLTGFDRAAVCQHLDDVCAAAPPEEASKLRNFEDCYRRVCAQIGVKLAPADDIDKGFSLVTRGVVLGVEYDTVAWTWALPPDKAVRLDLQISAALDKRVLRQDEVWSLVGRILHYAPLFLCGRFNIDHLLKANAVSAVKAHPVVLSAPCRRQLQFWKLLIRMSSGSAQIPSHWPLPAWTLEAHTDAAGGSPDGFRGSGGVVGASWFFLPWSLAINMGRRGPDGKRIGGKLSALELIGPLAVVVTFPDLCRAQPVRVWVDNAGSVRIWEKGYSNSCGLCTTLVKAISSVAAALDCRLEIVKIRRCSSPLSVMADALSQGDFRRFRTAAAFAGLCPSPTPSPVPLALRRWVAWPRVDDDLGHKLLRELALETPLLGYNVV